MTQVLLMAGGPCREYQFMRNVLERDKSFAVDVLLGTAAAGISQDARRILDAFPATAEELAEYDAIVAFDYDWRLLDPAAQARLERWVARESGGLVLVAGNVFMDAWLADPQTAAHPRRCIRSNCAGRRELGGGEPAGERADAARVHPRRPGGGVPLARGKPRREPDGVERVQGRLLLLPPRRREAGRHRLRPGRPHRRRRGRRREPIAIAGQFYGSGSVFSLGSGELWRLAALDDAAYERLATQLVRHVSQGRLMRGSRRARLLVDRDRFRRGRHGRRPGRDGMPPLRPRSRRPARPSAPDGTMVRVPLAAEPARPGTLQGAFVASREGSWRIEVDPPAPGDERLSRRIQAQLPDRELANPRLDRGVLAHLAATGGTAPLYLAARPRIRNWSRVVGRRLPRPLAARVRDRRRRCRRSSAGSMRCCWRSACGLLCLEWIVRRLVRLA